MGSLKYVRLLPFLYEGVVIIYICINKKGQGFTTWGFSLQYIVTRRSQQLFLGSECSHVTLYCCNEIYCKCQTRREPSRFTIELDVVPKASFEICETWSLWRSDQEIPACKGGTLEWVYELSKRQTYSTTSKECWNSAYCCQNCRIRSNQW